MSGSTASRRRAVRKLLRDQVVRSQAELVELLAQAGHRVTQATVSRDLDALGATKTDDGNGGRYVIPDAPISRRMRRVARALGEYGDAIEASGNLVVVRTPPGAAHLVGGAIDDAGIEDVIGTVAGDDTVLVVVREGVRGASVAAALERLGAGTR